MSARLLICGSRTFDDYPLMVATIDQHFSDSRPEIVINGGMAGADALSSYYAYERKINTLCFGAQWGDHGSSAGPRRNQQMLDEGKPTVVIAFYDKPRTESRGTRHMVDIAQRAGVLVIEVSNYPHPTTQEQP